LALARLHFVANVTREHECRSEIELGAAQARGANAPAAELRFESPHAVALPPT
jgi:hypothetical protein